MTAHPPVILIGGAWHGAWCWSLLQRELARRDVASSALDLLGFGGLAGSSPSTYQARPFDPVAFATERSGVAGLTLDDVRSALLDDVRALARGGRVAIVAHSISGYVVAAAVESAPELFETVIYLSAITPLLDLPAAAYNTEPEMQKSLLIPGLVGDPPAIGAARCDFAGDADWTRSVFYHDVPASLQDRAVAMLCTDVPFGIDGTVHATPAGLGSVRHAYIHTAQDRAIPLAMQRRIVREIDEACGGRTSTRMLDTSHSPFLSQPGALADHLVELTRRP